MRLGDDVFFAKDILINDNYFPRIIVVDQLKNRRGDVAKNQVDLIWDFLFNLSKKLSRQWGSPRCFMAVLLLR